MTRETRGRRIALVCEVLHPPFDEGIRICAARLAAALAPRHALLLVSAKDGSVEGLPVHGVLGNRWFLSGALASLLRGFDPDGILYVAWTSLTARTLARVGALRRHAPRARVGVMALQPRPAGLLELAAARLASPDVVLAAGPGAEAQARRLGIAVARVHPGVDAARFRPASPAERAALRARRGLDPAAFAVLHVGHLKASRNVGALARLARLPGVRCLLAAGTSTGQEEATAAALRAAGVEMVRGHEERIEEIYRSADAYVFPVTSILDAIETPLSVLEAAATGLPIVSTTFGGLPELLAPAGDAVRWADSEDAFASAVESIARRRGAAEQAAACARLRRLAEAWSWDAASRRAEDALLGPAAGAGS